LLAFPAILLCQQNSAPAELNSITGKHTSDAAEASGAVTELGYISGNQTSAAAEANLPFAKRSYPARK